MNLAKHSIIDSLFFTAREYLGVKFIFKECKASKGCNTTLILSCSVI